MNCVDDNLEQCEALWRQANTSPDHNAIIAAGRQTTFHSRASRLIGMDEANVSFPSAVRHLLQGKRDADVYLLDGHTLRECRIGEIHRSGS